MNATKEKARFSEFFRIANGFKPDDESFAPYPYQICLALNEHLPQLLNVPTGLGKTAAVILAWLWRRRYAAQAVRNATPRRLIYCLPMRSLVDQTESAARHWLTNLRLEKDVGVHVLMGGRQADEWDTQPEREAILIGTQDMLLSRALNRGYSMSRYRWPIHFALVNNDCLWVVDETQLMGVGLTTTAQLQGLRAKLGVYGVGQTLWMSATLEREALSTIDHCPPEGSFTLDSLSDADYGNPYVVRLINARKPLHKAPVMLTAETEVPYSVALAKAIIDNHKPETLTLVVLNRVARAQGVFNELENAVKQLEAQPDIRLIHSRFRPIDRAQHQAAAFDDKNLPPEGRIVVATQAIEAGVDMSARTLFTELAPWASLVQRFGRCNRRGEWGHGGAPDAAIFWIDIDPGDDRRSQELVLPYELEELAVARQYLQSLEDVGPQSLKKVNHVQSPKIVHTLRRKDLLDLWDTTPDLAGNDLDVSRYIRDTQDNDVQFFWRTWDDLTKAPPIDSSVFPGPSRDELCSVSMSGAVAFVKKMKHGAAWRWDPLERMWMPVDASAVRPGMTLLLHASSGGYDDRLGWTGQPDNQPTLHMPPSEEAEHLEGMEEESHGKPVPLTKHLINVANAAATLKQLLSDLPAEIPWGCITTAARWHDVGKAHPAFQTMLLDAFDAADREQRKKTHWAKSHIKASERPRYRIERDGAFEYRRGFRHELASAIAWLMNNVSHPDVDLIAFLIAAHHGKVRASIRSLPNEVGPSDSDRPFARGVCDGDILPTVDLGNGDIVPETRLSLDFMQLGESQHGPSWAARIVSLRDSKAYGPFRLAYLETLVRIADWRGSNHGVSDHGQ